MAPKAEKVTEKTEPSTAEPEQRSLAVDLLDFDPENPRFFSDASDLTEAEVLERMLDKEKVLELILSIGEKGFYHGEALLVVPKGERFTVVEGNRRLAALKLLTNFDLAKSLKRKVVNAALEEVNRSKLPTHVPCLIFPNRRDTLEYLGFRHITGAKPWGPLAKAKFLNQLRATLPAGLSSEAQMRSLAKTIGSYPKTVKELLVAYALYEELEAKKFFEIEGLSRETLEFGVFYTALKDGTISDYIGGPTDPDQVLQNVNEERFEELTRWMFERKQDPITGKMVTRIGESRNLVSLSRIMRNADALAAFRAGATLRSAAGMAGEQLEILERACASALESLRQANSLVNEVGEQLNSGHSRAAATIQAEAEELTPRIKKKVRENEITSS